jgi:hypothetical protein
MMVIINHVRVFLPVLQSSENDAEGFRSLVISSGILYMVVPLTHPWCPHINSMMVIINYVRVFRPVVQPSEDNEKGFRSLSIFSGILHMVVPLTLS